MREWTVQRSLPEPPAAYRSVAIGSGAQTSKLDPPLSPTASDKQSTKQYHPSDCIASSQMDKVHQEALGRVSSVSRSSEL